MKRLISLSLLMLVLLNGLNAQDMDYAMIYIYRPKSPSLNTDFPVTFNKRQIHKMPRHSKFAYKIYSQGMVNMELAGNVKISILVEHGKSYYIKSPNNGVSALVSEAEGQKDFNNDRLFPNGYVVLVEDIEDPIIPKRDQLFAKNNTDEATPKPEVTKPKSDVDINIPKTSASNPYRFALIIGNEDYSTHQRDIGSEVNVEFARNDATTFRDYAVNVLGVPELNTILLLDATAASMWQSVDKVSKLIKATNGKAEVIVYYAGHGLPDEATKEPFLIPVDVSGGNLSYAIKLTDVYAKLTEHPAVRITVFVDACFSGGARSQALLSARGVKVKPKENLASGNLVVFTASSGEQSSLAYKDKQHGLFTYFLLKRLQETAGDITYKQLTDFLKEQVELNSILINSKEQTPQTLYSPTIESQWEEWKLK
ncbi:MAG: caspase family protein [Tenuifilaceae bacterium]|jgi:hypothetical protein|nr:caspase family protein [Tenuifilaceae bacterium]